MTTENENELDKINKDWRRIKKFIEDYNQWLGVTDNKFEEKAGVPLSLKNNIENCLEKIQKIISENTKNKGGIKYSKQFIRQMLAGVYSKQLVVLAGRPGCGKTTFVQEFTKAVNAEAEIIAVQSNWVDKSDLLGYYNPIERMYIPTHFGYVLSEKVAKAKANPKKLFFICLDEMNLSKVEYYFADFLSALQLPTKDRKISLYSETLDCKKMLDTKIKLASDKIVKQEKLKIKFNNVKRFPPELEIPDNICFIGTINKDATTVDFSPKVVDRCYFIRMDKDSYEDPNKPDESETTVDGDQQKSSNSETTVDENLNEVNKLETTVDGEYFLELPGVTEENQGANEQTEEIPVNEKFVELAKKIRREDWMEKVNGVGGDKKSFVLDLSYRFINAAARIFQAFYDNKAEADKDNKLKDAIISGLILPKVQFEINEDNEPIKDEISKLLSEKEYSISPNIYKYMTAGDSEVTFWRE